LARIATEGKSPTGDVGGGAKSGFTKKMEEVKGAYRGEGVRVMKKYFLSVSGWGRCSSSALGAQLFWVLLSLFFPSICLLDEWDGACKSSTCFSYSFCFLGTVDSIRVVRLWDEREG